MSVLAWCLVITALLVGLRAGYKLAFVMMRRRVRVVQQRIGRGDVEWLREAP